MHWRDACRHPDRGSATASAKWRGRFIARRLEELHDDPRFPRIRGLLSDDVVMMLSGGPCGPPPARRVQDGRHSGSMSSPVNPRYPLPACRKPVTGTTAAGVCPNTELPGVFSHEAVGGSC